MKTVNEFLEKYKDYKIKDEEALLKLLERPKPKTVWDLQIGDTYYFLDAKGKIYKLRWDDDSVDNDRRANRRCYLTEKDAEFAREQEKVIAEMERLGGTKNMMSLGNENVNKFYINYSHAANKIIIEDYCHTHTMLTIYFATKEQAQKVIDKIGEDYIKKYLFYVKE